MPPKREYKAEDVIDAALEVVREKGFNRLSTRTIAEKLHSSTMPIYYSGITMPDIEKGVVALAGTAVLVLGSASGQIRDVSTLGVILVTISTMGWAIYTIAIKPVAREHGPFATACLALVISAVPTVFLVSPKVTSEIMTLSPFQWGTVAFLSIFATVLATGAWNVALGHMSSARAGMFLYAQPIVAALGGILLLHEEMTGWLAAGGALILAGVAISQYSSAASQGNEADAASAAS